MFVLARLFRVLAIAAAFAMVIPCIARDTLRTSQGAPDLQVEFLNSEKGYAVTGQSVTVLCVIRNVGSAALPEGTARVRCYPLSGLDFMEGQLWPTLPVLAPNQAVAYRWRLALSDQSTPLVFSVLITSALPAGDAAPLGGPGRQRVNTDVWLPPRVVAVSIPRFPSTPHLLGEAAAAKAPQAFSSRFYARVGNDRTLVNVTAAQDRVPLLVIAGREGPEWKTVAIATPCIRVRSSEEGQAPWTQSFRWTDTNSTEARGSAAITIQGNVGSNWGAHLVLEARADTGVIFGIVRITARRTVRIYSVQLPRLLATPSAGAGPVHADGSAALLPPDDSLLADQDRLAAAHCGALTFGLTWPATAPLNGWRSARTPSGDVEHAPVLGAEWIADNGGTVISAGATIEIPFRIFVFGASDTVRDALRFRIP